MSCTDCPPPITYPQIIPQFSLTNYIEIAKIDQICDTNRNQFDIIPYQNKTIKQAVAPYKITEQQYNLYLLKSIENNSLKIQSKNFQDILPKKSTLFFVNKNINSPIKELSKRLFNVWQTVNGTKGISTVHFPKPYIRFPYIMPSRGKIFRPDL